MSAHNSLLLSLFLSLFLLYVKHGIRWTYFSISIHCIICVAHIEWWQTKRKIMKIKWKKKIEREEVSDLLLLLNNIIIIFFLLFYDVSTSFLRYIGGIHDTLSSASASSTFVWMAAYSFIQLLIFALHFLLLLLLLQNCKCTKIVIHRHISLPSRMNS